MLQQRIAMSLRATRAQCGQLLLLLSALACSGADSIAGSDDNRVPVQSAAVASGGDYQGIEQLVQAFEAAFAAKDAVAYGNVYAENADFVNPVGVIVTGRAEITARHALAFAAGFAPATLTAELRDVQFLTGTIAIVDVFTTLRNAAGPHPPFAVVSPDGAVCARARWLAQKSNGKWEILLSKHCNAQCPSQRRPRLDREIAIHYRGGHDLRRHIQH
ncbi:MAG: SgcJ/EcaC family oxidoreductase [Gemmatimonadota bacterium]